MKKALLCALVCCLLLGTAAAAEDNSMVTAAQSASATAAAESTSAPAAVEADSLAAWLPYWETDASMEEAQALTDQMDELVAFAAIFDSNDSPLMLPDAEALYDELKLCAPDTDVYLSVVNDLEIADGQYENKSADLLRRLFKDDDSISRHISQLFKLVDDYHLTGLEIDYENIKSDTALWERFGVFIEKLYQQLSRENVKLRVVLSWDAPNFVTLPEGPEYSVMCYNLYGYHSGPGPKADIAFLEQTCANYQNVPGRVRMAFATGGFDWCGGKISAFTQLAAEALLEKAAVTPERDALSGAMHATFTLEGETHELWYADGTTLKTWSQLVALYGFHAVDLFRLGGNNLTDWQTTLLGAQ